MGEQKTNRKIKIFKLLLLIVIISCVLILSIKLVPVMKSVLTRNGQEAFRDKIDSMSFKGTLLLFSLQVSQILLPIFPGEPFEILAGMCYGAIGGIIFIFTSVFLTTSLIYFLVKKYKEKYLYNFLNKDKIQKILNSKWFNDSKKVELILIILFFIPGTPKDILVYLGAFLNIKPLRFILIATFARFPSVISSTMVGNNIISGDWKMIVLICAITAVSTFLFVITLRIFDKNKTSKDVIDSIK